MALSLVVMCLSGCGRDVGGDAGGSAATNLSVVVWPSLPPPPNLYQHQVHLQKLVQAANVLIATNPAITSIFQSSGKLAENSPLRGLLGIPPGEPALISCWASVDQHGIGVVSSTTRQRFGAMSVNLQTGMVDTAYDVEALFLISKMENQLRQTIGTREEALRLFGRSSRNSPSPEQEQVIKSLATALFLPTNKTYVVQMMAPGGSNRGQGYLTIYLLSADHQYEVARVSYPIASSGLSRPTYRFGSLHLYGAWTNINTAGFLLDSHRIPYPGPGTR